MKTTIFILTLILMITQSYSQKLECACDKIKIAEENLHKCSYKNFENGSRLYWQWNCDSVWLTFEKKEKVILKTCNNETVYGCQRVGLRFLKEYPNYLLFQYEWISGCCASPDIVFINKETGKEIQRVSQYQFIWGDIENHYLLYFSDTSFTTLVLLDHLTDRTYEMNFEANQIEKSARKNQVLRLTELFDNFEKSEDRFTFAIKLGEGELEQKIIEIK